MPRIRAALALALALTGLLMGLGAGCGGASGTAPSSAAWVPPQATTRFGVAVNVDADASLGTTFTAAVGIYDAAGAQRILLLGLRVTDARTLHYDVGALATDTSTTVVPVSGGQGELRFDAAGLLVEATGEAADLLVPAWAEGGPTQPLRWELRDASAKGLLTRLSGPSQTTNVTQDGAPGHFR
jgi:hypothetical protein